MRSRSALCALLAARAARRGGVLRGGAAGQGCAVRRGVWGLGERGGEALRSVRGLGFGAAE